VPDGEPVPSASRDGAVRLRDPTTGAALQTLEGHLDEVDVVTFPPDGKLVASVSHDGDRQALRLATGVVLQVLDVGSRIATLTLASDGPDQI
jgi:WD40 repeat protein